MRRMAAKCCLPICLVLGAAALPAVSLFAQQTSPAATNLSADSPGRKALADKLADLDQRVTAAQSAADNAWMLVSAALVLLMTGPGLASSTAVSCVAKIPWPS